VGRKKKVKKELEKLRRPSGSVRSGMAGLSCNGVETEKTLNHFSEKLKAVNKKG